MSSVAIVRRVLQMRNTKKVSEMKHFIRRAKERFGLELRTHDVNDIISKIRSGTAMFIEKQSLRCSLFCVIINDVEMFIVYDKHRKMIVTCMTREMIEENSLQ